MPSRPYLLRKRFGIRLTRRFCSPNRLTESANIYPMRRPACSCVLLIGHWSVRKRKVPWRWASPCSFVALGGPNPCSPSPRVRRWFARHRITRSSESVFCVWGFRIKVKSGWKEVLLRSFNVPRVSFLSLWYSVGISTNVRSTLR